MNRATTRLTNGAAETFPESADDLHAVVRADRSELKRTLGELETAVRYNMDVRARLLDHPLATVGVACVAGVALGVLSNRVQRNDATPTRSVERMAATGAAGAMTVVAAPFVKMATSVTTLVAQRLADVAEETLRRVLKPRSP